MTTPDSTDPLASKIREAAAQGIAFDALESVVGQKPMFRATTEMHVQMLRKQLVADPDHPNELPRLEHAKAAIYWDRRLAGDDPHIIGIRLDHDGTTAVFFAILTPP